MATVYEFESYNDTYTSNNTVSSLDSTTKLSQWNAKLNAGTKLENTISTGTIKSSFLAPDNSSLTITSSGGTVVFRNLTIFPDKSFSSTSYIAISADGKSTYEVIGTLTISPALTETGTVTSAKYSTGINTTYPETWTFQGSVAVNTNTVQGTFNKVIYTYLYLGNVDTETYTLANAYAGTDFVNGGVIISPLALVTGFNALELDSLGKTVYSIRFEGVSSVTANTNNLWGLMLAGDDTFIMSGDTTRDSYSGFGGNDTFTGDAGNNYFREFVDSSGVTRGVGNDTIDGGAGYDYVMYGSNKSIASYGFSGYNAGTKTVTVNDYSATNNSGIDKLINIEEIQFSDKNFTWTDLSTLISRAGSVGASFGVLRVGSANADGLVGTDLNDLIYGNEGNDLISAGNGNDTILGGTGNDLIDGGAGIDMVIYLGSKISYKVTKTASGITISSTADGLDTLSNVERIRFPDGGFAWDLVPNQSAGETALLLGSVLPGKLALDVSKQSLVGAVIDLFDTGYGMSDLAGALLRLDIWTTLTGQLISPKARTLAEDTVIVKYLLTNVYGIVPDSTTLNANASAMHNELSQGAWLAQLALSNAGQTHIGLVGLYSTGLAYG